MKKVIFILILAILGITNIAFGQAEKIESFDSVYVAGAEKTITPTYTQTFTSSYDGAVLYDGVVGFVFDVVNYVDTLTIAIFEGGYEHDDGIVYVPIDTLTELNGSRSYVFSQAPPTYQKYRIRFPLVSGDTATVENGVYFEKLPK